MKPTSASGNDHGGHPGHEKKTYIVTKSLWKNLCSLKRVGLKIPEQSFVEEIENELIAMIRENLASGPIGLEVIAFDDLCDEIIVMAHKVKQLYPDATVLSTAPLIAFEADGECIHLNRIINFNGDIIGIGPRPGHPSLSKQLRLIGDTPLIVIEDGSFTGGSLMHLLQITGPSRVKAIILGILFPKAHQKLEKHFDGEVHCHRNSTDDLVEWMPTHDFFPFIPNSGRVVGDKLGEGCFPYYLHHHASMSMPYIMPYGDPEDWASLRGDRAALAAFSSKCLEMTRSIFGEMSKLNDKEITVGDIINSSPRTNIPVSMGQHDFSDLTESVSEILTGDIQFLS